MPLGKYNGISNNIPKYVKKHVEYLNMLGREDEALIVIKENIQSDAMMKRENIILAKANLIVYLSDLAESFNAEIVICEQ